MAATSSLLLNTLISEQIYYVYYAGNEVRVLFRVAVGVMFYAKFTEISEKRDRSVPVIEVRLCNTHCKCTLTQAT